MRAGSGRRTYADELPTRVHDDELFGFIISNDLGRPIDEHEEVKDRVAVVTQPQPSFQRFSLCSEGSIS